MKTCFNVNTETASHFSPLEKTGMKEINNEKSSWLSLKPPKDVFFSHTKISLSHCLRVSLSKAWVNKPFQMQPDQLVDKIEDDPHSGLVAELDSLQIKFEEQEFHKDAVTDLATCMSECIAALDEDQKPEMSQKTATVILKKLKVFKDAWGAIDANQMFRDDSTFACRMFYSYNSLLALPAMKNYFQRRPMHRHIKSLCRTLVTMILYRCTAAVRHCTFSTADLREPLDNHEVFVLLLSYASGDFDSDSCFDCSFNTDQIQHYFSCYSNLTIAVPNLIKAGCPPVLMKWLTVANTWDVLWIEEDEVIGEGLAARVRHSRSL